MTTSQESAPWWESLTDEELARRLAPWTHLGLTVAQNRPRWSDYISGCLGHDRDRFADNEEGA